MRCHISIGNGTITAPVVVNNATVAAGSSPLNAGTLNIIGSLDDLGTSRLQFELAGPSFYDTIDILGVATIADGTIFDVDLIGGFKVSGGSMFDLLIADSIVGDLTTFVFDYTDAPDAVWAASLVGFDGREALRLTSVGSPPSGVPEVSATGSLAAIASLLALMAFLYERRRVSA